MRRKLWFVLFSFSFFCLIGCGDSPALICRDSITLINDIADLYYFIPDDDSAEDVADYLIKSRVPKFKGKGESMKKRWDHYNNADKDTKKEIVDAIGMYQNEGKMAVERYIWVMTRLDGIVTRLAEEKAKTKRSKGNEAKVVEDAKGTESEVARYADLGIVLHIIVKKDVCPNIYKLKADLNQALQGGGSMGPKEKEEDKGAGG